VERALLGGPDKRSIHYAETLAGDTTIGHATAYFQSLERWRARARRRADRRYARWRSSSSDWRIMSAISARKMRSQPLFSAACYDPFTGMFGLLGGEVAGYPGLFCHRRGRREILLSMLRGVLFVLLPGVRHHVRCGLEEVEPPDDVESRDVSVDALGETDARPDGGLGQRLWNEAVIGNCDWLHKELRDEPTTVLACDDCPPVRSGGHEVQASVGPRASHRLHCDAPS